MASEIVITSVPRGVRLGRTGFQVAMRTAGVRDDVCDQLEGMAVYRHMPQGGGFNPVCYFHRIVRTSGGEMSVLGRVVDAGVDYSNRSNKLAHLVLIEQRELPALRNSSPAAALAAVEGRLARTWPGGPEERAAAFDLTTVPAVSPGACDMWQAIAGDAGWAGVLADRAMRNQPTMLVAPNSTPEWCRQMLTLFQQALAFVPPERRWSVTFDTTILSAAPVLWRGTYAGSPEVASRQPNLLLIDLARPTPLPADLEGLPLVAAARAGRLPVAQSATGSGTRGPIPSVPGRAPGQDLGPGQGKDWADFTPVGPRPSAPRAGGSDLDSYRSDRARHRSEQEGSSKAGLWIGVGLATLLLLALFVAGGAWAWMGYLSFKYSALVQKVTQDKEAICTKKDLEACQVPLAVFPVKKPEEAKNVEQAWLALITEWLRDKSPSAKDKKAGDSGAAPSRNQFMAAAETLAEVLDATRTAAPDKSSAEKPLSPEEADRAFAAFGIDIPVESPDDRTFVLPILNELLASKKPQSYKELKDLFGHVTDALLGSDPEKVKAATMAIGIPESSWSEKYIEKVASLRRGNSPQKSVKDLKEKAAEASYEAFREQVKNNPDYKFTTENLKVWGVKLRSFSGGELEPAWLKLIADWLHANPSEGQKAFSAAAATLANVLEATAPDPKQEKQIAPDQLIPAFALLKVDIPEKTAGDRKSRIEFVLPVLTELLASKKQNSYVDLKDLFQHVADALLGENPEKVKDATNAIGIPAESWSENYIPEVRKRLEKPDPPKTIAALRQIADAAKASAAGSGTSPAPANGSPATMPKPALPPVISRWKTEGKLSDLTEGKQITLKPADGKVPGKDPPMLSVVKVGDDKKGPLTLSFKPGADNVLWLTVTGTVAGKERTLVEPLVWGWDGQTLTLHSENKKAWTDRPSRDMELKSKTRDDSVKKMWFTESKDGFTEAIKPSSYLPDFTLQLLLAAQADWPCGEDTYVKNATNKYVEKWGFRGGTNSDHALSVLHELAVREVTQEKTIFFTEIQNQKKSLAELPATAKDEEKAKRNAEIDAFKKEPLAEITKVAKDPTEVGQFLKQHSARYGKATKEAVQAELAALQLLASFDGIIIAKLLQDDLKGLLEKADLTQAFRLEWPSKSPEAAAAQEGAKPQ